MQIRWRSYELRPAGSPPIPQWYMEEIKTKKRPFFEQRMRQEHGLEVNIGPFGINSRLALRLAKWAESMGKGEAWHGAVFRAYFESALDISQQAVLQDLAHEVGLPADAVTAVLDDPQWDNAVTADVQQAFTYGLNSVPALIFNQRYLVSGAQPYAVLEEVMEKVKAELASGAH